MQANSEISVLHLPSDRLNCSGLLLLSTIFVDGWAGLLQINTNTTVISIAPPTV